MTGSPSNDAADDTAGRYRRVAAVFTERVEAVPAAGWARPSPCEGWLARDVVRHLVEWVPAFFADAGGPLLPAAPPPDPDANPDASPAGAWRALDTAIQAGLDDPDQAGSQINHPMVGPRRFDEAIGQFVLPDVFIHTWDLARATGQDETLDPAMVHELLVGMEPLDDMLRASGQYGPRVKVPADADEQTRLIAFTGRRP
jgi:uncharacterized protein (TIGR03086 family)